MEKTGSVFAPLLRSSRLIWHMAQAVTMQSAPFPTAWFMMSETMGTTRSGRATERKEPQHLAW